MNLKSIWKTNRLYRYLVISIIPIALFAMDIKSGILLIIVPLFLIIWTIILLKKQESLKSPNIISLQTTNIEHVSTDKNLIRELLKMFWYPHDTLEKNRETTSKQSFLGLLLLSIIPSLGSVLFMAGLKGVGSMYIFTLLFSLIIISFIHIVGKIFGGIAHYRQTIIGFVLSMTPFYFGLPIIGLAMRIIPGDGTLALVILWPTLGASLVYLWWMFKHYQEIRGIRLFLASLVILAGISALCFFIALVLASGART